MKFRMASHCSPSISTRKRPHRIRSRLLGTDQNCKLLQGAIQGSFDLLSSSARSPVHSKGKKPIASSNFPNGNGIRGERGEGVGIKTSSDGLPRRKSHRWKEYSDVIPGVQQVTVDWGDGRGIEQHDLIAMKDDISKSGDFQHSFLVFRLRSTEATKRTVERKDESTTAILEEKIFTTLRGFAENEDVEITTPHDLLQLSEEEMVMLQRWNKDKQMRKELGKRPLTVILLMDCDANLAKCDELTTCGDMFAHFGFLFLVHAYVLKCVLPQSRSVSWQDTDILERVMDRAGVYPLWSKVYNLSRKVVLDHLSDMLEYNTVDPLEQENAHSLNPRKRHAQEDESANATTADVKRDLNQLLRSPAKRRATSLSGSESRDDFTNNGNSADGDAVMTESEEATTKSVSHTKVFTQSVPELPSYRSAQNMDMKNSKNQREGRRQLAAILDQYTSSIENVSRSKCELSAMSRHIVDGFYSGNVLEESMKRGYFEIMDCFDVKWDTAAKCLKWTRNVPSPSMLDDPQWTNAGELKLSWLKDKEILFRITSRDDVMKKRAAEKEAEENTGTMRRSRSFDYEIRGLANKSHSQHCGGTVKLKILPPPDRTGTLDHLISKFGTLTMKKVGDLLSDPTTIQQYTNCCQVNYVKKVKEYVMTAAVFKCPSLDTLFPQQVFQVEHLVQWARNLPYLIVWERRNDVKTFEGFQDMFGSVAYGALTDEWIADAIGRFLAVLVETQVQHHKKDPSTTREEGNFSTMEELFRRATKEVQSSCDVVDMVALWEKQVSQSANRQVSAALSVFLVTSQRNSFYNHFRGATSLVPLAEMLTMVKSNNNRWKLECDYPVMF